jgi:hypothetical protein
MVHVFTVMNALRAIATWLGVILRPRLSACVSAVSAVAGGAVLCSFAFRLLRLFVFEAVLFKLALLLAVAAGVILLLVLVLGARRAAAFS